MNESYKNTLEYINFVKDMNEAKKNERNVYKEKFELWSNLKMSIFESDLMYKRRMMRLYIKKVKKIFNVIKK
jgi:hypothetical protein